MDLVFSWCFTLLFVVQLILAFLHNFLAKKKGMQIVGIACLVRLYSLLHWSAHARKNAYGQGETYRGIRKERWWKGEGQERHCHQTCVHLDPFAWSCNPSLTFCSFPYFKLSYIHPSSTSPFALRTLNPFLSFCSFLPFHTLSPLSLSPSSPFTFFSFSICLPPRQHSTISLLLFSFPTPSFPATPPSLPSTPPSPFPLPPLHLYYLLLLDTPLPLVTPSLSTKSERSHFFPTRYEIDWMHIYSRVFSS